MPPSDPNLTASRPSRPWLVRLVVGGALAAAVAIGAAACTSTADVSTGSGAGGGRGTDGTEASIQTTPPAAADPGQIEPAAPGADSGPTTTCVSSPATTTTSFDQGGGRITCSTIPPDGSASSPPMTDTTIPPPTTRLTVDNTHGVLVVSATGGLDCAPDEACPAIGVIMQGTIEVEGADGAVVSEPIDQMGLAGFRLVPGTYDVRAVVSQGECQAGTATVGLARVDVALSCVVPR